MDKYSLERDGQIDFYTMFLPRVDRSLDIDQILADNNDGVINGNLIEFKLHVSDLNAVLFQCIKYLSALRIKGKPVPANILIVDLNASTTWVYHAEKYLDYIEKIYYGGASRDNSGFIGGSADNVIHYDTQLGAEDIIKILKEDHYTKIHVDENCIVGWATSFYKTVPTARKEDFLGDDSGKHKTIGEIRNPVHFEKYIYPYTGQTNVKFSYLMDKLNDTLQKKNLGAFYTPKFYADKSIELVRAAISRVPRGNDYIILDRCAGTGNLESGFTDEELSHCIVSTIEYYEYKVLQELLGSKVRHIIPPIETSDTFNAGLVTGADALSEEYIKNPIIKGYIDDPKCTIILFENPPYAEANGTTKTDGSWKNSYAAMQMKQHVGKQASNELGNIFIWSAFQYYLRQPTDSYIVYSPVKYWKVHHLVSKKFLGGYAFNRRHFHTNIDACIMCAYWSNEDADENSITITGYDYDVASDKLIDQGDIPVHKLYDLISKLYDGRSFDNDEPGIACDLSGSEAIDRKCYVKKIHNKNIVGFLCSNGSGFDNPDLNSGLTVSGRYDGHGCYIRKDTYLEKLPLFCASRYITYNRAWTERARIMKSGDGADRYLRDVMSGKLNQWLRKCLLFTCLEMQNHMRTFIGSDGHFYRNELCLDCTNGDTLAIMNLATLTISDKEQALIDQWNTVLAYAKKTNNYNPSLTYGVYQIFDELDTYHKDEKTKSNVYDNVELHTALTCLKVLVKKYYNSEIVPMLFEYEFLK